MPSSKRTKKDVELDLHYDKVRVENDNTFIAIIIVFFSLTTVIMVMAFAFPGAGH